ncbi:unnamed protein product, partial [Rotaria sp. Silwood2]
VTQPPPEQIKLPVTQPLPGQIKPPATQTPPGQTKQLVTQPPPEETKSSVAQPSLTQTKPPVTQPPRRSTEPSDPSTVQRQAMQLIQQQKMDHDIRHLLQYHDMDDIDILVVDDGPVHRLLLVHPERPLPVDIQRLENLRRRLQTQDEVKSVVPQKVVTPVVSQKIVASVVPEKIVTPIERQKVVTPVERQKVVTPIERQKVVTPVEPQKQRIDDGQWQGLLTQEEKRAIMDAVIQQLIPLIEESALGALEQVLIRRNTQYDGNGFIPFPFMFDGSVLILVASHEGLSSEMFQRLQQKLATTVMETNFGEVPDDAALVPSALHITMTSDLTGEDVQDEIDTYSRNEPPSPQDSISGPEFVEGY